jgi:hypothetical protein
MWEHPNRRVFLNIQLQGPKSIFLPYKSSIVYLYKMDEFAQSRGEDDLFSDDFEPASAPTLVVDNVPAKSISHDVRNEDAHPGTGPGAGDGISRGQDRRRGGTRNHPTPNRSAPGGLASSRYATQEGNAVPRPQAAAAAAAAKPLPTEPDPSSAPDNPQASTTEQPIPSPQAATPRTTAVRGDRSATGGPAHKKLTEQELSEKMAKMAIINAQKAERFRLSEADSAAFQQKEVEMRKKRVAEQKNARAMDMERAKNRERKLQAQGGREWDSEKQESDIVDRTKGRSSEYVRGGHGGVMRGDFAGKGYSSIDDDTGRGNGQHTRGRGGVEGRGRGNRGGRGGRGGKVAPPALKSTEEFPHLPISTEGTTKDATKDTKDTTNVKSPVAGADWAEFVLFSINLLLFPPF